LTFSFDIRCPAPDRRDAACELLPESPCVFMSLALDPLPRWLLLPLAAGSGREPDGAEPPPLEPPVWDHACGAITTTVPLSKRLDSTPKCAFFIFSILS
jgi:hypothetical protein